MRHITFASLNFAPDGFTAPRAAGLGAGHDYGVAAMQGRLTRESPAKPAGSQQDLAEYHNAEGFDEGLVHRHGWAYTR